MRMENVRVLIASSVSSAAQHSAASRDANLEKVQENVFMRKVGAVKLAISKL